MFSDSLAVILIRGFWCAFSMYARTDFDLGASSSRKYQLKPAVKSMRLG
jgi:hypothetical protein